MSVCLRLDNGVDSGVPDVGQMRSSNTIQYVLIKARLSATMEINLKIH